MTNVFTMTRDELKAAVTANAGWIAYRDTVLRKKTQDVTKGEWQQAYQVLIMPQTVAESDAEPVAAEPVAAEPVAESDDDDGEAHDILAGIRNHIAPSVLQDVEQAVAAVVADLETERTKRADAERRAAAANAAAVANAEPGTGPVVLPCTVLDPARPVGKVLGVGSKTRITMKVCDSPLAPKSDDAEGAPYIWPEGTLAAVAQMDRGENVFLFGPAGTGKTSFARNIAAKSGRPYFAISFHGEISFDYLIGFEGPAPDGGTQWVPGQLLRAITTPHAVVSLEEIGYARSALIAPLLAVLQDRRIVLSNGTIVDVAEGVSFFATNNNSGVHDDTANQYSELRPLNYALRDRFGARIEIGYLPKARESKALAAMSGVSGSLADMLVEFATLTRVAAAKGEHGCQHAVGLRRLKAWGELVADGIPSKQAFAMTITNGADPDDALAYDQIAAANLDHARVDALAAGEADPAEATTAQPTGPETEANRYGFDAVDDAGNPVA